MRIENPVAIPFTISIQTNASALSLIAGHEECLPWLYSTYVNIVSNHYCPFLLLGGDSYCGIPWIEYHMYRIKNDDRRNVIEFITELIMKGLCVFTTIDFLGILTDSSYKHNIFIYGIDTEKNELLILGYSSFSKGKYEKFTLSCDKFTNGFISEINLSPLLLALRKKNEFSYDFNHESFINVVRDYLNSKLNLDNFSDYYEDSPNTIDPADGMSMYDYYRSLNQDTGNSYGISTYQFLDHVLYEVITKRGIVSRYHSFRMFQERMQLMFDRFKFFKKNDLFPFELSEDVNAFGRLSNAAKKAFVLIIKHDLSPDSDMLERVRSIYTESRKEEEDILSNFIYKYDRG